MKIKKILAIMVLQTVIMFAAAQAAVLPKTAQLVGADTIVLIDISDFNQLRARFEKSVIYRLYKDPAMAAFVANFEGKWREKMAGEKDAVIKTLLDANSLPAGRMAFALAGGGGVQGQEMSILLISQWGPNAGKIKEAVEKMTARAVEDGAHRAIESYRDVNLVTLTTESAPRREPDFGSYKPEDGNVSIKTVQPPPERVAYCFIDDCLIAGTGIETVKFAVAQIQGASAASGSALSADVDYMGAMGAVGPYHDVDIYVNLKQLLKRFGAEDTTGEDRMFISNLGLDGLSGLGCSLGFVTDGDSAFNGKAFLKTTGSRKGVLKMLETRSWPVKPPPFVPASAYSVSFLNIDIKRAYDELNSIMFGLDPVSAMSLQKPIVEAGQGGEPAVTLRSDIIEFLGSEIVVAQNINKPFVAGVAPTDTLIAISISNRSALEKSLSRVHKQLMVPNNPEPTRELLGHTIYLLGPGAIPFLGGPAPVQPSGPGPRAVPAVPRMAFTITETHLIMGEEAAVERAVRIIGGAQSDSVNSAKWFTTAKSVVPSVVGMATFEDSAASMELLWWMLKESAKSRRGNLGMGSTAAVLATPDLWQSSDFALLPEFDVVRKYFGFSAFYGVSRDDGFLFEFKYLNPR
jgi:hypothetical protein